VLFLIGKTLAHYEIIGLLGKGGMGEVYRARDTKLGREVALKLLPPDFARDPDRLHRFEREARLLASLNHGNIATIHGFEQDSEHHFLVLELVEGETLAELLSRGRISTRQVLTIARQIAEGMEAAHERGIIHRDLKPANIKQTGDGGLKILDFGLARVNEVGVSDSEIANSPTMTAGHTRDGTLLGTAPYMSPEQLKGEGVDARADIWSFGCVLFEMLTGASPFWANSSAEIMARTLGNEPEWDKLPRDLPPSMNRLIRRCLVKDANDRLHSAADIRILLQETIEVEPETVAVESRSRKSSAVRLGVIALVGFALGALALWFSTWPTDTDLQFARDPVRLMIPVRDDTAVIPMPESPSVAISPDGRVVVYVASGIDTSPVAEGFARTQLYRRPIDSFEASPIDGTIGASSPFFSPDSEWVGFFDFHDGVLRKVPLAGGAPVEICFIAELSLRGACWAENGEIYFADSTRLFVVDEGGGEPRSIASPDLQAGEKTFRFPDALPGARALLFTRASSEILSYDDADIAVLDLISDEVRVLVRGGLDPQYVSTGHIVFGRGGKAFAVPFNLDRLDVSGSPVEVLDRVVTSDGYGAVQLSVSRNGTLAYVEGGPEQFSKRLMILNRDGGVDEIPQPPRPYGNVELAPDAGRIAISVLGANAGLWIYDLARGTMTRLISDWDNYSPVWSRSGDEIAFGSNRSGESAIWITAADGSGSPAPIYYDMSYTYPSSWSPDGQWIATSGVSVATGMDIWLVNRSGDRTAAIQSAARELRGMFSPDGGHMAYSSDESGQLEIYVQALPFTGRKWKLSEEGGEFPRWSREGDAVYYWSEQRLMTVPVDIEPEFRPSRARQVLKVDIEVHDYDVFPGGERFVVLGRSSTPERAALSITRGLAEGRLFPSRSPDVRVVLNWFEELNRLVPQR
jgi:serine/threonine-protein kinase